MANIYWQQADNEGWIRSEIRKSVVFGSDSSDLVTELESTDCPDNSSCLDAAVLCLSQSDQAVASWVLLAPSATRVRINGTPLESGIRVLTDRDAVRVDELPTLYFSTERLPRVEAFPSAEPVYCPRCKLKISEGDMAVCCPQCNVWHHQQESQEQNCWSYTDTCALCDQATDIETANYRWTPEGL